MDLPGTFAQNQGAENDWTLRPVIVRCFGSPLVRLPEIAYFAGNALSQRYILSNFAELRCRSATPHLFVLLAGFDPAMKAGRKRKQSARQAADVSSELWCSSCRHKRGVSQCTSPLTVTPALLAEDVGKAAPLSFQVLAILEVKSKSQKRPSHAKHCILEAFCTRYGESEVWTITGGGRPALSTPSKSHCSSPYKLLILQETPTFIAPIR